MTISRPVRVIEGVPFSYEKERADQLRSAFQTVKAELGLRVGGLTQTSRGQFRIDNVIGTVLAGNLEIEIAPKTKGAEDWVASVLALLSEERVTLTGERRAGEGRRASLLEALSGAYADRLERVLDNEGPITLLQNRNGSGETLQGSLDVERWVLTAAWQPHILPYELAELSPGNAYNSTLAFVAILLASATRAWNLRSRLTTVARRLVPDGPLPIHLQPGIEDRPLPDQWSSYRPAWELARLIIRQRLPLSERRELAGMAFAIEPWPLLEKLLERCLRVVAADLGRTIPKLTASTQSGTPFLKPFERRGPNRGLRPDAVLRVGGRVLANFEAKYRNFSATNKPLRDECYQAITAARALGSPLAVLVYPGVVPTAIWTVLQPGGCPERLAVIGLDMFAYVRGSGERERAREIVALLNRVDGLRSQELIEETS